PKSTFSGFTDTAGLDFIHSESWRNRQNARKRLRFFNPRIALSFQVARKFQTRWKRSVMAGQKDRRQPRRPCHIDGISVRSMFDTSPSSIRTRLPSASNWLMNSDSWFMVTMISVDGVLGRDGV